MKLTFVNHAGFIVETGDIVLLCDPWFEGTAFNNGWELLSPSVVTDEELARVTHLWFSHEHPDHFSPASLKRIPADVRERITVLFQATTDRKVAKYCEKLGFGEVRELEAGSWHALAEGADILCNPLPTEWDADSWMCLRDPEHTLVNLNDCGVYDTETAQAIKEQVGAVDLLMTQFSYAAWTGNPEDRAQRKAAAEQIFENVRIQIDVLQPRQVVPFASFVWFSSPMGYHLNRDMNRIGDVAAFIASETEAEPVVLYPGDHWAVGTHHDTATSVARYDADFDRIPTRAELPVPRKVPEEELFEASRSYVARLREAVSPLLIQLDQAANRGKALGLMAQLREAFRDPEPGFIHVDDLDRSYSFDPVRGLRPVDLPPSECHIRTSSESLLFALKFLWGGETLQVSAQFREVREEGDDALGETADQVFKQFRLGRSLDLGRDLNWGGVVRSFVRKLEGLFPGFEARG